jgi:hypothetical protein
MFGWSRAGQAENMRKWARMRARGPWHFVLVWGVLVWGGFMFLVMGLGFTGLLLGAGAYAPKLLALNAWLWLAGGLLFGMLTWYGNERLFRKHDAGSGEGNP